MSSEFEKPSNDVPPEQQVRGSILMDFTRRYFIIYKMDGAGRIIEEDIFRYPYDLKNAEVRQEVRETYGYLFDYANTMINGGHNGKEERS